VPTSTVLASSGAAPVAPVETTGGEAIGLALVVALFLLLLLVLWWRKTGAGRARSEASRASQASQPVRAGQPSRAGGVRSRGPRARTPSEPALHEMDVQASRVLVETDNAVRTSEQELGFAVARFGQHAAAQFSQALGSAREELAAAFQLRQHLDEAAEPARVRQSMLARIGAHCAEANRLLDEQAEDFDRLQDLPGHAGQLLPEVENHIKQQAARIDGAQDMLRQLGDRYTPGAMTSVAASPEQARERLEAATVASAQARESISAADNSAAADDSASAGGSAAGAAAAGRLHAAELSADQAESLLDSIGHLQAELTRAASALPAAMREIDADVAESSEMLADRQNERRASAVARAEASAATVRGQIASGRPFDPLAALRELEQAGAGLDRALADTRQQPARQEHARGVLDQAMLLARSSLTGTDDYITTRRGGVGATARTRLAEAQRHYLHGVAAAQADPESALARVQDADTLAQEARSLAQQDVQRSGADSSGDVATSDSGFGGAPTSSQRELVGQR
jgi:hypothetical protein